MHLDTDSYLGLRWDREELGILTLKYVMVSLTVCPNLFSYFLLLTFCDNLDSLLPENHINIALKAALNSIPS